MAFPASPTNGQTTTINGTSYVYNSTLTVWQKQGSMADASPVASVAGRTGAVTLSAADIGSGTFPGAITAATTLNVTGATVLGSTLNAGTTTLSALTVSGASSLAGVTAAALAATTGSFSSTVGITGAATVGSTLAVTGAVTLSSTCQTTSLGVGAAPSGTAGQILASNSITAYYSDERLKNKIGKIESALDKIDELSGFLYTENELAKQLGFNNTEVQVALSAQAVKRVQPEATALAPFDRDEHGNSKSGEYYLTVMYERLVPLLVEGIKELRAEIKQLKGN